MSEEQPQEGEEIIIDQADPEDPELRLPELQKEKVKHKRKDVKYV